jgi:hypothetical protein
MVLQFLKLSSILGNFMMTLLNDFTEVPFSALCCMASTIFLSNFVAGELFLGDSPPITPPISTILTIPCGTKTYFPVDVDNIQGEKLAYPLIGSADEEIKRF